MKKSIMKFAFVSVLALGTIGFTSISATTVDAEGGTWKYYKSDGLAHSEYLHNSKKHASAVTV